MYTTETLELQGLVYKCGMICYLILFTLLLAPAWVQAVIYLTLLVYIFNDLPFQEIWNPSVRELYPFTQIRWEKAIMKTLRRWRILKTRAHLPAEIWQVILPFAIDPPFLFDTHCDSTNFHLFIRAQAEYHPGNRETYLQSEKDRANSDRCAKFGKKSWIITLCGGSFIIKRGWNWEEASKDLTLFT
ncbi:hypothetical protein CPB86DRAFT_454024 [Serendipita vermifera]|nr:hypothetical protein CPB86DRAFT_454024 [Serendipita vermifera]